MDVESLNKLFELFGVNLETFVFISGVVFFVTKLLKEKYPNVIQGRRTDILAVVLALGLGFQAIQPKSAGDFVSLVVLALFTWLVPAGVHKQLKPK